MRIIIISLVLLVGCIHAAPVASSAPTVAPNRAIVIVTTTDKDAKCADLRKPLDVEDSALCVTGGALLWLSASAAHLEIKQLSAPPQPTKVLDPTETHGTTSVSTPETKAPVSPVAKSSVPVKGKP